MAVNFGILQPIQSDAKPLMGSAPGASAGSIKSAGAGANLAAEMDGFLSSYSKGLQVGTQNENLKQEKLQTEDMEIKAQDRDRIRAAAAEGIDAVRAEYYATDPVKGVQFDTDLAKQQEQLERVKSVSMDNFKKAVEGQAIFYGNVAAGKDDIQRAQIYDMTYKNLPDALKGIIPEKYSPSNFAAGMLANQNAIADLAPKKQAAESPLGKLQADANAMQAQITKMKQLGQDTTAQEQQLQQLQQSAQQAAERKVQVSSLEKEVDKQEAKRYGESMDAYDSAKTLTNTLDLMDTQLKKVPSMAMGPFVNFLKANANSEEAKTYNSLVNYAAMQLRMATMKGAGSMSDADREFLESMVGGLAVTKNSATQIIKNMREIAERAKESNYQTAEGIMKQTSKYQAWKEANPSPGEKKAMNSTNQQGSSGFQEGQIYQDANGNKAKYVNGKWESM